MEIATEIRKGDRLGISALSALDVDRIIVLNKFNFENDKPFLKRLEDFLSSARLVNMQGYDIIPEETNLKTKKKEIPFIKGVLCKNKSGVIRFIIQKRYLYISERKTNHPLTDIFSDFSAKFKNLIKLK